LIPDLGSAIFKFIPIYRSDDGMLYLHKFDSFSHTARLVFIIFWGSACFYGTERTTTCADIAENHERCGSCTPAFSHIGAVAALTDGMQVILIYQSPYIFILFSNREFYPEPIRSALFFIRYYRKLNHSGIYFTI
jgi:hypothetical protein